jgi:RNA-directed DNA polymerase
VKPGSKKPKPVTVPFAAKQAGEAQVQFPFGEEASRWTWVESSIWTDRMLTALEQGVKGGRWFSLIDKVYSPGNLQSAATEVARNGGAGGVDRVTIEMFMDRKEANLARLSEALQRGTYAPRAVRRTWIPKPGTRERRPLGVPMFPGNCT